MKAFFLTFLLVGLIFFAYGQQPPIAEKPDGVRQGINYHENDDSSVTLCLLAPGKKYVYVIGDFNNWTESEAYLMNQTPDGEEFWLEISGLEAGREYAFQYSVESEIRIGDPYTDKVLDPNNDYLIPSEVYPDIPSYTGPGIASVLQTAQVPYEWSDAEVDYTRRPKEELVVYELLVRDFLGSHSYLDLIDTLGYLKGLGINAVELMPIMEFEGNESWGYNPSYFFAPDKYYGTKNHLKAFIDSAHNQGIAVILDMVLNHAFGQNAMVQLYWDATNNRPAANSPWFNPEPRHPFNVGYDFNHESLYTQAFVDSVNRYWLTEYHFDGYRFDLSKGFTQNQTSDVGVWSQYDPSRVALLERMADKIWEAVPDAYVILEHFADGQEEELLTAKGMMTWNNRNYDYRRALAGFTSNSFTGSDLDNKVTYMESHDEERLMYESIVSGQDLGTYQLKDTLLALERMKLGAAFFLTVPGPRMLWQFQELGYDVAIDFNGRTGNKPLPWGANGLGYYEDALRQQVLEVYRALLRLRREYIQVFNTGDFSWVSNGKTRSITLTHNDLEIAIVGNFDLESQEVSYTFPSSGNWYSMFRGDTLIVSSPNRSFNLAPGEFRLYTTEKLQYVEENPLNPFRYVVYTEPVEFISTDQIDLYFNAAEADPGVTAGLAGAEKVYFHSGVVTDDPEGTSWSTTIGNLGQDDGIGLMEKVEAEEDLWKITFTPADYYSLDEGDPVFRIGMFFRDAADNNRGYGFGGNVIYINPAADPNLKIVETDPEVFNSRESVKIIFNAVLADPAGTPGLIDAEKVYMHSGAVTGSPTSTSWDYVIGNWGEDDGVGEMERVPGESNKWQKTLVPRTYYGVDPGDPVYRIGMVFRNGDGSAEGKGEDASDIFIDVSQTVTGLRETTVGGILPFPNPTDGRVVLKPNQTDILIQQVSVMDASGRLRLMEQFALPRKQVEINLNGFKKGIYFIRVRAEDGRELTYRLAKE